MARSDCVECGAPGTEVDHALPLAVADELGLRWAARARLPGNLRWLCHACHVIKTGRDRALLAALREPQTWALPLPLEAAGLG